jgi:hypothetical protein
LLFFNEIEMNRNAPALMTHRGVCIWLRGHATISNEQCVFGLLKLAAGARPLFLGIDAAGL